MNAGYYNSPIGLLEILGDETSIHQINFVSHVAKTETLTKAILDCQKELEEYFLGTRKEFTVQIHVTGTDFRKKVWQALCEIPYGETATYKDVATKIGNPKASRAIGNANNKNPLPIILPCHRVVGSNKQLIGYAGGLDKKSYLLKLEEENK